MYRVSLDNVGAHRTLTPLHEKHQATPYATFLDADETGEIFSGMVMTRTGADTVALVSDAGNQKVFGLAALDRNDTIDDLQGLGIQPFTVWQGGPDAYFTVDAPAFDDGEAYVVPTDGTRALLYANDNGQISSAVDGDAIAELIEVVSDSRIIIRLLAPSL